MSPRRGLPGRRQTHDRSGLAGGGTHRGDVPLPKAGDGDTERNTIASPLLPALLPPSRFLLNLARSHLAWKPGKYRLQWELRNESACM